MRSPRRSERRSSAACRERGDGSSFQFKYVDKKANRPWLCQETFTVSEIGEGAFEGQKLKTVTLPDTIKKVDTNAFKDCGITELNVNGKVTKKLFAKNSLSGCGSKSKGKGLTINVQSKRDMKQMKKLLKRAGAAKAKVKTDK